MKKTTEPIVSLSQSLILWRNEIERFMSNLGRLTCVLGVVLLFLSVFAAPNYLFADEDSCYSGCESFYGDCSLDPDPPMCWAAISACFDGCAQGGKVCSTSCGKATNCCWDGVNVRCTKDGDPGFSDICSKGDPSLPCKDCQCVIIATKTCGCTK
jgi:hypothetical protein